MRFRGIRTGKVVSIGLDPDDRRYIIVRARIASNMPLTKSTTARLNSLGVTGQSYVQLEDSGTSNELLPDSDPAPRIELKGTVLDVLSERAPMLLAQVSDVATKLNRLLDERNIVAVNRTLENLATASEGLKEVPRVMASVKEALSSQNLKRLQTILADLERTAGQAAPLTVEMRGLVASLTAASHRLDEVLADTGGEITTTTLPRVNALVEQLQGNSRQLTRVLEGLEASPQALIFGRPAPKPGPGEPGFVLPGK